MFGQVVGGLFDRQPWLYVPFFVVAWCAGSYLISALNGWQTMARAFPADHVPSGPLFRWRTLMFSLFQHYGNCINVILSPEGIYMAPALLMRIGHPPVLLPWSCVQAVESSSGMSVLVLSVEGKRMSLFLPAQITGDLERLSNRKAVPLSSSRPRTQPQNLS